MGMVVGEAICGLIDKIKDLCDLKKAFDRIFGKRKKIRERQKWLEKELDRLQCGNDCLSSDDIRRQYGRKRESGRSFAIGLCRNFMAACRSSFLR